MVSMPMGFHACGVPDLCLNVMLSDTRGLVSEELADA